MSTKKNRGLGRGLSVLIGENNTVTPPDTAPDAEPGIRTVAVRQIRENPHQPRERFDPENLRDLVESVRRHGVLQPLLVRRVQDNEYELIAGERRLRAARATGLDEVPVIVRDVSDEESLELALVENLQREDLNPVEEAEGYHDLITRFGLTQEQAAQRVGKARASIANALRLLSLNEEVRLLLAEGRLAVGHAKVLLGVADASRQRLLAMRTVAEHLSVRQLERLVAGPRRPIRRDPAVISVPDDYMRRLSDLLHRHFGTAVRVTPAGTFANGRKSKGRIEIDFYSNEELQRLLELMGLADSL